MNELKITTFNIRCFGFGGEYYQKEMSELRGPYLKHFLEKNYSDTDVFVFQEIMNPLYLPVILPKGFKTYTYEHDYKRHMFIVIACRKELEIKDLQTIPDTALDDETSRPALYGLLTHEGQPLLDIIGVHLKSKSDHTDSRIQQAKAILKFIETLPESHAKLMTGDFNSHVIESTLKDKDDLTYLQEVFEGQLKLIAHNSNTYLSSRDIMSLDHFFISGAKALSVEVYNLPDYSPDQSFKNFYNEISDHLPVTIHLKLS